MKMKGESGMVGDGFVYLEVKRVDKQMDHHFSC